VFTKTILLFTLIGLLLLCACKATPPGKFETSFLSSAKHKILVGNRKARNPVAASAENIAWGRDNFSHYCAACHGLDGQNTGVPFADRMSPPVPVLTSASTQSYTDGQLKWIIDNGIFPSGMPASRGIFRDDEIWSIVLYIRHLPPPGSLGEPPMYSNASFWQDIPELCCGVLSNDSTARLSLDRDPPRP
jgi:mono/diheme cytochrome c family protein